jgi:hypothetical protein
MRKATLTRVETGLEGTFGKLSTDSAFGCETLELPWRGNAHDISCIPEGVYLVEWDESPAHGFCYHYRNVPGRDHCLLHAANLAGDIAQGYVAELKGCTAPGITTAIFAAGVHPAGEKHQRGVTGSGVALHALEADMAHQPFELTVVWAPGAKPQAEVLS